MQNEKTIKIKPFKNGYCDAVACALSDFINVDCETRQCIENNLSNDEIKLLCEFSALKNKLAGVSDVNLKVPRVRMGICALEKYGLDGFEVLDSSYANGLNASDLLAGRLMLEIANLQEHNGGSLAEISDFCGLTHIPILIHFGRDLESVGKIVNKFSLSPATLLEEYGFLDRQCYLYGMNYIDKDDQILLSNYNPTLILSPKSDGYEGKGGINLYNLIYNRLKFVFSSGNCYNIDMLKEGLIALLNTNNLMNCSQLVSENQLIEALCVDNAENELDLSACGQSVLESRFVLQDEKLLIEYRQMKQQIIQIANKIKEKLNGN